MTHGFRVEASSNLAGSRLPPGFFCVRGRARRTFQPGNTRPPLPAALVCRGIDVGRHRECAGVMIAGSDRVFAFFSPVRLPQTMLAPKLHSSGVLRQAGFSPAVRRLCCEHCRCAMDTRSDFAEIDLHILTFDIPDDELERAAGDDPAITLVRCTNPLVWECPALNPC